MSEGEMKKISRGQLLSTSCAYDLNVANLQLIICQHHYSFQLMDHHVICGHHAAPWLHSSGVIDCLQTISHARRLLKVKMTYYPF